MSRGDWVKRALHNNRLTRSLVHAMLARRFHCWSTAGRTCFASVGQQLLDGPCTHHCSLPMMAFVNSLHLDRPPRSPVRYLPSAMTSRIARWMLSASWSNTQVGKSGQQPLLHSTSPKGATHQLAELCT